MRFPLPAVAAAVAVLFLAPPARATDEPDADAFLRDTIGAATLQALPPADREKLLRHTEALLSQTAGSTLFTRCLAPDTPPLLLEAYQALDQAAADREPPPGAPAPAQQLIGRWTATATNGFGQGTQGLPVTLTWSIVPDGTPIPSDSRVGDSNDPSNLRSFLAGVYGGDPNGAPHLQPWFADFEAVFANISAQTGLSYVYEPNDDGLTAPLGSSHPGVLGTRGDIRIGGHNIDGNGSTLAYNLFPDHGDMIIDTNDSWLDLNEANPDALNNLIEHEHGHGLGLLHVCPNIATKIMEPQIHVTFRGIQFDDLYSLQRHYGDVHEKHNAARNNDSIPNATTLPVNPGVPFSSGWLSIDDDADTDFFAISATAGSTISVRVVPSPDVYPEAQQTPRCNAGQNFDSSTQQDLTLDLLAPDGTTVLASGAGTPAGTTEEIVSHITPSTGTHFIRVDENDGGLDTCQLYRLEVTINPPGPELDLIATAMVAESFQGQNGVPDPGETIRCEFTLLNRGSLPAANVHVSLTGPAGFTSFSATQEYGGLAAGQSATGSQVFALEGACADEFELQLQVAADGGYSRSFPIPVTLGTRTATFSESADTSATLPTGWSSTEVGDADPWVVTTNDSASAPHSLFTPNTFGAGAAILESPPIALDAGPSVLSFTHRFLTEFGFDGGVLEISTNGSPWTDIVTAGGLFTARPYSTQLDNSPANNNPLKGRQAWSGNSDGFVTSSIRLPPASQGQSIRLRWILGSDNIINQIGWWVDDVVITDPDCDAEPPLLALTSPDPVAAEFFPLDTASLFLSTPLPSLTPLTANLQNAGTATLGLDVGDPGPLTLPAGETSREFLLTAIPDGLPEGPETLELTLTDGLGQASITLLDAPYDAWAFSELGSGPLSGPYEDFEGDGLANLVEYAHHTDPRAPNPPPNLLPRRVGAQFQVSAPLATLPADVRLGAETSPDLLEWSPSGITTLPDGFQVPLQAPGSYLRLTYERLLTAP